MKNKVKRAASRAKRATVTGAKRVAAGAKRAAAATASGAKRVAVAARSKYDSMRKGKNAPKVAPTPYVNQNGNRIYKSNNGAVFTKNADGDRNYAPVANGIKKPNGNNVTPINKNNANTVPNKIRPNKN